MTNRRGTPGSHAKGHEPIANNPAPSNPPKSPSGVSQPSAFSFERSMQVWVNELLSKAWIDGFNSGLLHENGISSLEGHNPYDESWRYDD